MVIGVARFRLSQEGRWAEDRMFMEMFPETKKKKGHGVGGKTDRRGKKKKIPMTRVRFLN